MKTRISLIITLLLASLLISYSQPPPTSEASPARKTEKLSLQGGVELYSWKTNTSDWCFSFSSSNNRKQVLDVSNVQEHVVIGMSALKSRLFELSRGEQVHWVNLAKEPLPSDMYRDLCDFCDSFGLYLDFDIHNDINSCV